MKILLLQDEIYLPSFGGGIKANRRLMESLARLGHTCTVICQAFTPTRAGPNNQLEFMQEMARRQCTVRANEPHVFCFTYNGVHVEATNFADKDEGSRYITRHVHKHKPDWVLVNEDKRRFLL